MKIRIIIHFLLNYISIIYQCSFHSVWKYSKKYFKYNKWGTRFFFLQIEKNLQDLSITCFKIFKKYRHDLNVSSQIERNEANISDTFNCYA